MRDTHSDLSLRGRARTRRKKNQGAQRRLVRAVLGFLGSRARASNPIPLSSIRFTCGVFTPTYRRKRLQNALQVLLLQGLGESAVSWQQRNQAIHRPSVVFRRPSPQVAMCVCLPHSLTGVLGRPRPRGNTATRVSACHDSRACWTSNVCSAVALAPAAQLPYMRGGFLLLLLIEIAHRGAGHRFVPRLGLHHILGQPAHPPVEAVAEG